jgi:cytochrome c553
VAFFWILLLINPAAPAGARNLAAGKRKQGICAACHVASRADRHYPILAGQSELLAIKLNDFRDRRRTTDAGVMRRSARSLTDADIDDLGNYFANVR